LRNYLEFQEKKLEKMRTLASDLGNLVGDDALNNNHTGGGEQLMRYPPEDDNFSMP
jgi:hypothetical protein